MAKLLTFTAKATFPLAACLLAASLGGVARAADKAQLSGRWNFNAAQSDDAKQKVDDAQVNNQRNPTDASGGGQYPGGGSTYPGAGGGGYPTIGGMGGRGGMGGMGGMGGPGGMGRGGRQSSRGPSVNSDEWDRLAANPQYLRIDQRSDQFVVADDSDQSQTFYPDGKKHEDKDADGKKITTKADWEGDDFVAETKLNHSQRLTQTFRLSRDGKQLYVTTRFDDPSMSAPLSIRRVYDLSKTQQH